MNNLPGVIKLIILEGALGLLLIDRLTPERFERAKRWAFATLAGLMVLAWSNWATLGRNASWLYVATALPLVLGCGWLMGVGFAEAPTPSMTKLRDVFKVAPRAITATLIAILSLGWVWYGVQSRSAVLVHQHEQFHFYLGAKYLEEVGSFDLYEAAVLADKETVNVMANVTTTRDVHTFNQVPVGRAFENSSRIKGRFTPERWETFKADWVAMTKAWPGMNWGSVVNDHGNSNSPPWAVTARLLTVLFPISAENQALLGWVDMLLMLAMWLFVFETFGTRIAAFGLLGWAMEPIVFDYLAGSLLRWDWLFALGMAACFLKRGRYATAGAFAAFAAATKLFPIFFSVALLLKAAQEFQKMRVIRPEWRAFAKGAAISGVVCVAVSTAMFGAASWKDYYDRIQVAQHEKFYGIQYSLKTVFLQQMAPGDSIAEGGLFPREIKQARSDVEISDFTVSFFIARLFFTVMVALLARRATDVEAFLLGPLLVFTWLTVNMYYWNMLGLLALGLVTRKSRPMFVMTLTLPALFAFYYVYQLLNRGFSEGYAVASLMCVWIVGVAMWEYRDFTQSPASVAQPVQRTKTRQA